MTMTAQEPLMTTPEPMPTSTPRRRPVLPIIAGVAAILLIAWGWHRYMFSLHHVETDDAQLDGHITPVAPKVQAFVARVLVEENQPVRLGDTLVILDSRDLGVRLAQAEANLATALAAVGTRQRVGQMPAELAATQAQELSAQAAVVAAEATYRKTSEDLKRIRGLAEKQIVPAQQLDAAEAAYQSASASLDAARRQAAAMSSQVAASGAMLTAAESRVLSARAEVDNAKLQLGYAVITAPATGTVGRRSVEPGALVQVGQTLLTVIPDHSVWVTANMKETDMNNLAVGDSATFTVDAYPGRRFTGHVESISPATGSRFALLPPDNATGNFTKVVQRVPVRVAVDSGEDATHALRPGMSVVVTITTR